MASTRTTLRSLALLTLISTPALAQVTDDADLDIRPWNPAHTRCLKLATSRDGIVVAAFVLQSPIAGQQADRLVVMTSRDAGRSWQPHYVEPQGALYFKDIALAVASGQPAGVQNDRWIYIAVECVNMHHLAGGIARVLEVYEGPLDTRWNGRAGSYPYVSVCGGTLNANATRLNEPLHWSATIAPYQENGRDEYMLVVANRWVENGDEVYISTPLRGAKGRTNVTGWTLVAGAANALYRGGTYAHPSVAADPSGRGMFLALEDRAARTVKVAFADPFTFRTGTGLSHEFETDPMRGVRSAPEVSVDNNTAVLTCLGAPSSNVPGASELHWYWKQRANPFSAKGLLHNFATSNAPLVMTEGQVFAVAHCVADPNPGVNPGFATAFNGRARDPMLTTTRVGDRSVVGSSPTVAVINAGTDRGVFGYTTSDDWLTPVDRAILIDAGR